MGKENLKHKNSLTRKLVYIGLVLILISFYPIYKNYKIPNKAELMFVSGKIESTEYKRDRKGSEKISVLLYNDNTKYIIDDVLLKGQKQFSLKLLKDNEQISIGYENANIIAKELLINTDNIYTLKLGNKNIINYEDTVKIRYSNNLEFFLFFLTIGIISILMAILYNFKTKY